eukprot:GFYU01005380.1.p1 GENE.GFYU01005380.1~~GFYU01005380.1.p1  ORF type:complete len:161 (+),score=41.84 GFYU01005380.1:54-536(+)
MLRAVSILMRNTQKNGWKDSFKKLYTQKEIRVGSLVGTDELGNKYYEGSGETVKRGQERWVEYKDWDYDGSAVPAEWHPWLHHATEHPPTEVAPAAKKYNVKHSKNPTLTRDKYLPPGHVEHSKNTFNPGSPGWTEATRNRGPGIEVVESWQAAVRPRRR